MSDEEVNAGPVHPEDLARAVAHAVTPTAPGVAQMRAAATVAWSLVALSAIYLVILGVVADNAEATLTTPPGWASAGVGIGAAIFWLMVALITGAVAARWEAS